MGRGQAGNPKAVSLFISALFMTCLLPLVSAAGGGAVIEVSTFSLLDFETTEQSTYDLNFTVTEVLSNSADIEAIVELSSLDGTVFDSLSQNHTLTADSSQVLEFSLTSIPYGYTVVNVEIIGEVGSPNSNQTLSLNRTIHRLQPIDISLASEGQILLNGLTSLGTLTGNVSLHDGDYLQTQIAVINDGDFSWAGYLSSSLSSATMYDNQTSSLFTVAPLSSTVVQINSTIALSEGTSTLMLQLNDSGDGNIADELHQISFEVGPPPLPYLAVSVEFLSPEAVAGDEISWNLSVSNSGQLDYQGQLMCTFGSEILFDATIQVAQTSSITELLTSTSRPNLLVCSMNGMRIDDNSVTDVSWDYAIESAAFESAGSSIPALLNGPWHQGDMAIFSMLVRNHGELPGSVSLVCESNGVYYSSNVLLLDIDAAGEVTLEMPMTLGGQQEVNWSLFSSDGSIDSGMNGMITVPVAEQQTLVPKITSVTWDAENGVQLDWSLEMSEGIDRPVRIRLGYTYSGLEAYPIDYDVTLSSGLSTGTLALGFIDADRVSIRATPLNWTTGFGFSSHSLSVPSDRPSYGLDFSPISVPNRPLPGETGSVTVVVSNSGDIDGRDGYLVLSTQGGEFLGEQSTTAISSNSEVNYQFTFEWPDYQSVSLKAIWVVGSESFEETNTFQSGEVIVEEASFSIPWVGIFGGVMMAIAIGAFIRIYQNRQIAPSTPKSAEKKPTSKSSDNIRTENVEKIQVGCPECARQLRVPSNYGGQVRCPDCSTSFEVQPRVDTSNEDDASEEIQDIEEDGKIELHCPSCEQSLRIPEHYRGSVRCPSCEEVFSAEQNNIE
ncbi:MAG: hypothetical protein HOL22_01230 [Euryarchaeota archaeon]|jgi:uncharacterized Zn finger protein (UPF0148 family)|nr:hypothetical protein [Euryarchaeota archaeon]MBT5594916.1 hypothetical protein [Euryarchaeota archaeon]MBT6641330.1 hypothetical protein [Euryarchaeota archaeon]MBT6845310.1 hypothetical protein [Euryarchaeota archaeon]MBT7063703.1 hypothetical protein [Euryarchaeota archaeon]